MVQGELFTDDVTEQKASQRASFFSSNQLIIGFDKLVLFSIVFLILTILIYSFGYERGYKAAERKINSLTAHIETLTTDIPNSEALSASNNQTIRVLNPTPTALETAQQNSPTVENSNSTQSIESAAESISEVDILIPQAKYTIQIATVLSRERAEKEVEKLTQKTGALKPFFIKRGRYFEICAGGFDTVANAKPLLTEFKAKNISSDAFVRPLN